MVKAQKWLLWLFGAMFLVPEVLWSPVLNFIYSIWVGGNVPMILRDNFLINPDNRNLAITIILIQCIGALLFFILLLKTSINIIFKIILSILFFIFFIFALYVFIILSMMARY